jgi:hypothetical protein
MAHASPGEPTEQFLVKAAANMWYMPSTGSRTTLPPHEESEAFLYAWVAGAAAGSSRGVYELAKQHIRERATVTVAIVAQAGLLLLLFFFFFFGHGR